MTRREFLTALAAVPLAAAHLPSMLARRPPIPNLPMCLLQYSDGTFGEVCGQTSEGDEYKLIFQTPPYPVSIKRMWWSQKEDFTFPDAGTTLRLSFDETDEL